MNRSHDVWIDIVKIIACILVTLGHLYPGLVNARILADGPVYRWFRETVYYIHVPLFFLCSGYLYQKYTQVNSVATWKHNVIKKGINLGIPYVTFSIVTWLFKALFAGSVNTQNSGLLFSLFLEPIPPFWYLYTLFFLFALMPTFASRKQAIVTMVLTVVLRFAGMSLGEMRTTFLERLLKYGVWFATGMTLTVYDYSKVFYSKKCKVTAAGGLLLFFLGSVSIQLITVENEILFFLMGILGCFSIVILVVNASQKIATSKILEAASQYTMPVFLMHTIFAAGIRVVLLRLGIAQSVVHVCLGLLFSFCGPVLTTWIMQKLRPLDLLIYPWKYIRIKKQ